jgi:integrase-like protein
LELAPARRLARTKGDLDDAVRLQMIEDMKSAGLAAATQTVYIDAVRRLAADYRRSPDQLNKEEVRRYLLGLRERGVALGTFRAYQGGIQFLYRRTLDRDWALFQKKEFGRPNSYGFPRSCRTSKSAHCWAA